MAFGAGGDAEVGSAHGTAAAPHPAGRLLAALCFLVVLAGVAIGTTIVVASGFGKAVSFEHIYPTTVSKRGDGIALNARLRGVVDWLVEGYPAGVLPKDYIPLIAILRRRLSDDEIRQIGDEIATQGDDVPTTADIGVSGTRITDALPTPADIARVEEHLVRHHDWPLEAS